MTSTEAITKVEKASNAKKLFGDEPHVRYRELAKLVHPDVVEAKLRRRAELAFRRLGELYATVNGKAASISEVVIGKWLVGAPIAKGDIADVYSAEHVKDGTKGIFKIARDPRDTDLLEEEYFALSLIGKNKTTKPFLKYTPKILDKFEASDRRVNVLTPADGMALRDICEIVELDFRHLVWMANRSLNLLGAIHQEGIIHGAVVPSHLMFGPVSHSLTLLDWCYAVTGESKKHIPAIVRDYENLYPKEVLRKKPPTSATDIYMLFASMKSTGAVIPRRFKALFDWCLAESPKARPQDAWALLEKWLDTAEQEYGAPKYLKLDIPVS